MMTETEIMEALERALTMSDEPIGEHFYCGLTTKIVKEVQDLINRKNAKIDELQIKTEHLVGFVDVAYKEIEKNAITTRAETIKEFIEKAKAEEVNGLIWVGDLGKTAEKMGVNL